MLKETGYLNYLDDGTEEGLSRAENVLELRTVAASYEGLDLTTFLEEVSLVSDVDTRDDETQAPSLLTLHAAKGLEFPVVFIVGLEEGVLPHIRAMEDPSQMQEERRLMYVGITRAKDRLYLLYAFRRSLFGDSSANMPSRFLYDIPENVRVGDLLRQKGTAAANTQSYRDMTRWDRAASVARQQQERQRPRRSLRASRPGRASIIASMARAWSCPAPCAASWKRSRCCSPAEPARKRSSPTSSRRWSRSAPVLCSAP